MTSPSRSGAPTPLAPLRTPVPKPTPTVSAAGKADVQATPALGPPKPGGSVAWAAEADPGALDPYAANGLSIWGDLTYQSLVMFDDSMKLVPCLAEAWKLSDDRLTWTFRLRQGVAFHDGSEFEAEDVAFWFERTTAPGSGSPFRGSFGPIVKVTPKGKYEVEFALEAPHAPFLATLASLRGSAIVPHRWMQSAGARARTSAMGSGPFRIAEYVPGSQIRYVRHREYWEKGLPYLDEVRLLILPDEGQRVEALRSGRVTYATIGPTVAQQVRRELTVLSAAGPGQVVTVFNTRRKPFDDVRVRQAISLVVDRPAAIQQATDGEGRLTGPVPIGLGEWASPPESLPYRKDLATAKHLLNEAGYADGFEAAIKAPQDHPVLLRTATLLAEQVQALGISLRVEPVERAAFVAAVEANDFDLHMHRIGFLPDPDAYLSPYAAQGRAPGSRSLAWWENARYDELVEQGRAVMDPGARKNLYDEAAGIVMHEAPLIWWFTENTIEAVHASVKGYRQSFTGRRLGLKKTWLGGPTP